VCIFVDLFVLPVLYVKAQSQYPVELQPIMALEVKKAMVLWEIEKVKAEMINLMGEMLFLISKSFDELTVNFNEYFELVPKKEEIATSTATSTATTTEEIEDAQVNTQDYSPSQPPPYCPFTLSGSQTWTVSTNNIPTILEIKVDPFDVQYNSSQTVTVNIKDGNGNAITAVSGQASTDTKTSSFNLSLLRGEQTNGIWQGTWVLKDSVCVRYLVKITAKSDSGTSNVSLSFK